MIKKQLYEAPTTEVLKLRLEGVIATSETRGISSVEGSDWEND